MKNRQTNSSGDYDTIVTEDGQIMQRIKYDFALSRRGFVQVLGAGIVIASTVTSLAQQEQPRGGRRGGRGGGGPTNLAARIHIAKDGAITVMSGKVEGGQGSRAQITQAAAEELRVAVERVRLILADTELCPDDGGTFGSQTTPRTLPSVRSACAAARQLLISFAAGQWNVGGDTITLRDGVATDAAGNRKVTYADLASSNGAEDAFRGPVPPNAVVTPVAEWKVMGNSTPRPNARDLVTGKHEYPSAIVRPGMQYGKILRAPSYGATLKSVDVSAAKAMEGVTVVQDGNFVGVVAPTTYQARKAIAAIEKTAQWERPAHPASKDLPKHLRSNARGGMPANPYNAELAAAAKTLKASYDVTYVQHSPLEPRSAVAEWEGEKLTVWHGGQNPFNVRTELATAMRIPPERVRLIVPDFGSAYGGKHTGETAVEAARLARAAGKPVAVFWTREEEFTWASFRSAAAIDIQGTLDASGKITSWFHAVVQGSNAAPNTPYNIASAQSVNPTSDQPLRLGSYRALGSTANMFARESFMDELAIAAGKDPLEFRLAHLENPRIRGVLEDAAKRFNWAEKWKQKAPNVGVGLACGTEKNSFVAACVEVAINPQNQGITVRRVCETFECGAIVNPTNLYSQVQGAILQGLGPALREEMEFENGVVLNPAFSSYKVPRFADLPELDINLLNRPDLPSVGAGETPLIALAPAIGNAVFHATGVRLRRMPMKLETA